MSWECGISQRQGLQKECTPPLHVVIIAPRNRHTQARAHVPLFSNDLALAYPLCMYYDGLRFPIAVHFRDTTQSWGLEDFMHIPPTGVTKAANLSLFMVNVAYRLHNDIRQRAPDSSLVDLQADCRGSKSVEETIQRLPEKPEPVLFAKRRNQGTSLGRIHLSQPSFRFA